MNFRKLFSNASKDLRLIYTTEFGRISEETAEKMKQRGWQPQTVPATSYSSDHHMIVTQINYQRWRYANSDGAQQGSMEWYKDLADINQANRQPGFLAKTIAHTFH